jgi:integrase
VLLTCYGSGLRISEAVALKVSDIDSQRKLIRVQHGKGAKDRYTILSPCLLEVLRAYYRILRGRAAGGCSLPGARTCICPPAPCNRPAAKPGSRAA